MIYMYIFIQLLVVFTFDDIHMVVRRESKVEPWEVWVCEHSK